MRTVDVASRWSNELTRGGCYENAHEVEENYKNTTAIKCHVGMDVTDFHWLVNARKVEWNYEFSH